jgi:hypothetical protein
VVLRAMAGADVWQSNSTTNYPLPVSNTPIAHNGVEGESRVSSNSVWIITLSSFR